MLRRDDDSALGVALDLEVSGKRKRTTEKDLEEVEETDKIGLKMEDALNQAKGRDGVRAIAKEWVESGHL